MKKYAYIGIGGFAGAIIRYLTEQAVPSTIWGAFPINTLVINIVGCFILAIFLTLAMELWELKAELRLGIATGLLGAFTTFSAFCGQTAILLSENAYVIAATYCITSPLLGLTCIYLGNAFGREIISKRIREGETR